MRFVIGHELGHHAAGHLNPWLNLIKFRAHFAPLLSQADSRARESTCDAVGFHLSPDVKAAQSALAMLGCGCRRMNGALNCEAFAAQEAEVPRFFGWLTEIFRSHPRLTKRVRAMPRARRRRYQGALEQRRDPDAGTEFRRAARLSLRPSRSAARRPRRASGAGVVNSSGMAMRAGLVKSSAIRPVMSATLNSSPARKRRDASAGVEAAQRRQRLGAADLGPGGDLRVLHLAHRGMGVAEHLRDGEQELELGQPLPHLDLGALARRRRRTAAASDAISSK